MDSKFIITQLINAAVTVLTTIIVVRVTMKGNLDISPRFRQRLKHTVGKYGALALYALILAFTVIVLVLEVWYRSGLLATRLEVFMISALTTMSLFMFGVMANAVLEIISPDDSQKANSVDQSK